MDQQPLQTLQHPQPVDRMAILKWIPSSRTFDLLINAFASVFEINTILEYRTLFFNRDITIHTFLSKVFPLLRQHTSIPFDFLLFSCVAHFASTFNMDISPTLESLLIPLEYTAALPSYNLLSIPQHIAHLAYQLSIFSDSLSVLQQSKQEETILQQEQQRLQQLFSQCIASHALQADPIALLTLLLQNEGQAIPFPDPFEPYVNISYEDLMISYGFQHEQQYQQLVQTWYTNNVIDPNNFPSLPLELQENVYETQFYNISLSIATAQIIDVNFVLIVPIPTQYQTNVSSFTTFPLSTLSSSLTNTSSFQTRSKYDNIFTTLIPPPSKTTTTQELSEKKEMSENSTSMSEIDSTTTSASKLTNQDTYLTHLPPFPTNFKFLPPFTPTSILLQIATNPIIRDYIEQIYSPHSLYHIGEINSQSGTHYEALRKFHEKEAVTTTQLVFSSIPQRFNQLTTYILEVLNEELLKLEDQINNIDQNRVDQNGLGGSQPLYFPDSPEELLNTIKFTPQDIRIITNELGVIFYTNELLLNAFRINKLDIWKNIRNTEFLLAIGYPINDIHNVDLYTQYILDKLPVDWYTLNLKHKIDIFLYLHFELYTFMIDRRSEIFTHTTHFDTYFNQLQYQSKLQTNNQSNNAMYQNDFQTNNFSPFFSTDSSKFQQLYHSLLLQQADLERDYNCKNILRISNFESGDSTSPDISTVLTTTSTPALNVHLHGHNGDKNDRKDKNASLFTKPAHSQSFESISTSTSLASHVPHQFYQFNSDFIRLSKYGVEDPFILQQASKTFSSLPMLSLTKHPSSLSPHYPTIPSALLKDQLFSSKQRHFGPEHQTTIQNGQVTQSNDKALNLLQFGHPTSMLTKSLKNQFNIMSNPYDIPVHTPRSHLDLIGATHQQISTHIDPQTNQPIHLPLSYHLPSFLTLFSHTSILDIYKNMHTLPDISKLTYFRPLFESTINQQVDQSPSLFFRTALFSPEAQSFLSFTADLPNYITTFLWKHFIGVLYMHNVGIITRTEMLNQVRDVLVSPILFTRFCVSIGQNGYYDSHLLNSFHLTALKGRFTINVQNYATKAILALSSPQKVLEYHLDLYRQSQLLYTNQQRKSFVKWHQAVHKDNQSLLLLGKCIFDTILQQKYPTLLHKNHPSDKISSSSVLPPVISQQLYLNILTDQVQVNTYSTRDDDDDENRTQTSPLSIKHLYTPTELKLLSYLLQTSNKIQFTDSNLQTDQNTADENVKSAAHPISPFHPSLSLKHSYRMMLHNDEKVLYPNRFIASDLVDFYQFFKGINFDTNGARVSPSYYCLPDYLEFPMTSTYTYLQQRELQRIVYEQSRYELTTLQQWYQRKYNELVDLFDLKIKKIIQKNNPIYQDLAKLTSKLTPIDINDAFSIEKIHKYTLSVFSGDYIARHGKNGDTINPEKLFRSPMELRGNKNVILPSKTGEGYPYSILDILSNNYLSSQPSESELTSLYAHHSTSRNEIIQSSQHSTTMTDKNTKTGSSLFQKTSSVISNTNNILMDAYNPRLTPVAKQNHILEDLQHHLESSKFQFESGYKYFKRLHTKISLLPSVNQQFYVLGEPIPDRYKKLLYTFYPQQVDCDKLASQLVETPIITIPLVLHRIEHHLALLSQLKTSLSYAWAKLQTSLHSNIIYNFHHAESPRIDERKLRNPRLLLLQLREKWVNFSAGLEKDYYFTSTAFSCESGYSIEILPRDHNTAYNMYLESVKSDKGNQNNVSNGISSLSSTPPSPSDQSNDVGTADSSTAHLCYCPPANNFLSAFKYHYWLSNKTTASTATTHYSTKKSNNIISLNEVFDFSRYANTSADTNINTSAAPYWYKLQIPLTELSKHEYNSLLTLCNLSGVSNPPPLSLLVSTGFTFLQNIFSLNNIIPSTLSAIKPQEYYNETTLNAYNGDGSEAPSSGVVTLVNDLNQFKQHMLTNLQNTASSGESIPHSVSDESTGISLPTESAESAGNTTPLSPETQRLIKSIQDMTPSDLYSPFSALSNIYRFHSDEYQLISSAISFDPVWAEDLNQSNHDEMLSKYGFNTYINQNPQLRNDQNDSLLKMISNDDNTLNTNNAYDILRKFSPLATTVAPSLQLHFTCECCQGYTRCSQQYQIRYQTPSVMTHLYCLVFVAHTIMAMPNANQGMLVTILEFIILVVWKQQLSLPPEIISIGTKMITQLVDQFESHFKQENELFIALLHNIRAPSPKTHKVISNDAAATQADIFNAKTGPKSPQDLIAQAPGSSALFSGEYYYEYEEFFPIHSISTTSDGADCVTNEQMGDAATSFITSTSGDIGVRAYDLLRGKLHEKALPFRRTTNPANRAGAIKQTAKELTQLANGYNSMSSMVSQSHNTQWKKNDKHLDRFANLYGNHHYSTNDEIYEDGPMSGIITNYSTLHYVNSLRENTENAPADDRLTKEEMHIFFSGYDLSPHGLDAPSSSNPLPSGLQGVMSQVIGDMYLTNTQLADLVKKHGYAPQSIIPYVTTNDGAIDGKNTAILTALPTFVHSANCHQHNGQNHDGPDITSPWSNLASVLQIEQQYNEQTHYSFPLYSQPSAFSSSPSTQDHTSQSNTDLIPVYPMLSTASIYISLRLYLQIYERIYPLVQSQAAHHKADAQGACKQDYLDPETGLVRLLTDEDILCEINQPRPYHSENHLHSFEWLTYHLLHNKIPELLYEYECTMLFGQSFTKSFFNMQRACIQFVKQAYNVVSNQSGLKCIALYDMFLLSTQLQHLSVHNNLYPIQPYYQQLQNKYLTQNQSQLNTFVSSSTSTATELVPNSPQSTTSSAEITPLHITSCYNGHIMHQYSTLCFYELQEDFLVKIATLPHSQITALGYVENANYRLNDALIVPQIHYSTMFQSIFSSKDFTWDVYKHLFHHLIMTLQRHWKQTGPYVTPTTPSKKTPTAATAANSHDAILGSTRVPVFDDTTLLDAVDEQLNGTSRAFHAKKNVLLALQKYMSSPSVVMNLLTNNSHSYSDIAYKDKVIIFNQPIAHVNPTGTSTSTDIGMIDGNNSGNALMNKYPSSLTSDATATKDPQFFEFANHTIHQNRYKSYFDANLNPIGPLPPLDPTDDGIAHGACVSKTTASVFWRQKEETKALVAYVQSMLNALPLYDLTKKWDKKQDGENVPSFLQNVVSGPFTPAANTSEPRFTIGYVRKPFLTRNITAVMKKMVKSRQTDYTNYCISSDNNTFTYHLNEHKAGLQQSMRIFNDSAVASLQQAIPSDDTNIMFFSRLVPFEEQNAMHEHLHAQALYAVNLQNLSTEDGNANGKRKRKNSNNSISIPASVSPNVSISTIGSTNLDQLVTDISNPQNSAAYDEYALFNNKKQRPNNSYHFSATAALAAASIQGSTSGNIVGNNGMVSTGLLARKLFDTSLQPSFSDAHTNAAGNNMNDDTALATSTSTIPQNSDQIVITQAIRHAGQKQEHSVGDLVNNTLVTDRTTVRYLPENNNTNSSFAAFHDHLALIHSVHFTNPRPRAPAVHSQNIPPNINTSFINRQSKEFIEVWSKKRLPPQVFAVPDFDFSSVKPWSKLLKKNGQNESHEGVL